SSPHRIADEPQNDQCRTPEPRVSGMSKEGGKSAQCAWLFSHAHLIGKSCVQCDDGAKIHFSSSAFDALSLVLVVFAAEVFFGVAAFFLTVFAGFTSLARRAAAFTFASDLRCCFARSVRSNSS